MLVVVLRGLTFSGQLPDLWQVSLILRQRVVNASHSAQLFPMHFPSTLGSNGAR